MNDEDDQQPIRPAAHPFNEAALQIVTIRRTVLAHLGSMSAHLPQTNMAAAALASLDQVTALLRESARMEISDYRARRTGDARRL